MKSATGFCFNILSGIVEESNATLGPNSNIINYSVCRILLIGYFKLIIINKYIRKRNNKSNKK